MAPQTCPFKNNYEFQSKYKKTPWPILLRK